MIPARFTKPLTSFTLFSKWGTDEKGLFKFFCSAPPEHLKKLNLIYADKYGYTLLKVMEKELGGDAGRAGLFLLGMKLKPYETIAKLIEKACKGKIHKFVSVMPAVYMKVHPLKTCLFV